MSVLELTCNAKTSYLQEIVGRIKSAIEIEKLELAKLEIFNLAAEGEIIKLK